MMQTKNPFSGEVEATFEEHTKEQIQDTIEKAWDTFTTWKDTSFAERAPLMRKAGEVLREHKEKYAQMMTTEMGKPLREALGEVEKCALVCDYYADHAEEFLKDSPLAPPDGEAYIAYDPIGPVLAIMPWNFPFWQIFRFAAPNLMAGNVGILKHASNVPQCALAIQEVFEEAGFPKGCFQTLLINSSMVGDIIANDKIRGVTLTGSEGAGSKVAEQAGRAIKKTVLELGGSDPFIVLKDADIEKAAKTGAKARMINCGQSCIAAKRFILVEDIADEFLETFKKEIIGLKLGDPTDEDMDYGPMAREDLAEELMQQVTKSIEKGAKWIGPEDKPFRKGAFFSPGILVDVKPGMPAYEEELFGPVATVLMAKDEEEAIRLANDSRYGLGGSLWSQDIEKAKQLVRKVNSGAVYINKLMASHPTVPFGGVKMSGYGRELSHPGIKEFVNQKTVWIS